MHSAAWATKITIPMLARIVPAFASVGEVSTDGANFLKVDPDLGGTGFAFAVGGAVGGAGTVSGATAFAKSPGLLPGLTFTTAFTKPVPARFPPRSRSPRQGLSSMLRGLLVVECSKQRH